MTGLLAVKARIAGTAAAPEVTASARLSDASFAGHAYAGALADIDYKERKASLRLTVQQDAAHSLNGAGTVPLHLSWSDGWRADFAEGWYAHGIEPSQRGVEARAALGIELVQRRHRRRRRSRPARSTPRRCGTCSSTSTTRARRSSGSRLAAPGRAAARRRAEPRERPGARRRRALVSPRRPAPPHALHASRASRRCCARTASSRSSTQPRARRAQPVRPVGVVRQPLHARAVVALPRAEAQRPAAQPRRARHRAGAAARAGRGRCSRRRSGSRAAAGRCRSSRGACRPGVCRSGGPMRDQNDTPPRRAAGYDRRRDRSSRWRCLPRPRRSPCCSPRPRGPRHRPCRRCPRPAATSARSRTSSPPTPPTPASSTSSSSARRARASSSSNASTTSCSRSARSPPRPTRAPSCSRRRRGTARAPSRSFVARALLPDGRLVAGAYAVRTGSCASALRAPRAAARGAGPGRARAGRRQLGDRRLQAAPVHLAAARRQGLPAHRLQAAP